MRAAEAAAGCANCGAPFVPERRRFCPECGQETRIVPPTLGEFAQQFGGAYFSTEGALWRTLKLLLFKPGELTRQYLAGRRKHYVLPLRLYLSVSLLLLLLTRGLGGVDLVQGVDTPRVVAAERGPLPTLVLNLGPVRMGVREGTFVCQALPALLCRQIQARAATDTHTLLAKVRRANERVAANAGLVMFVLLPLFAACLKLANWGSGMRYTEHLVFALHLHAFWFLVLAVVLLVPPPLHWPGLGLMAVYTLVAGRRVYGGTWPVRLARALVLTALYTLLLALTVPLAWLLALLL